jgi:hypothetical protein
MSITVHDVLLERDEYRKELANSVSYTVDMHNKVRDLQSENQILRYNVKDLQGMLNRAQVRIVEIGKELDPKTKAVSLADSLQKVMLDKEMVDQGYDPTKEEDVKAFWNDLEEVSPIKRRKLNTRDSWDSAASWIEDRDFVQRF